MLVYPPLISLRQQIQNPGERRPLAGVLLPARLQKLAPLMVLVVVEGGPNTLVTVEEVLKKGRPVVVLARSGRAASGRRR